MPEEGAAKCFAYVQTYDTKPKRRLFELMKSQGLQANQQVTFLSDGADDVRELPLYLSPESEHWLDWFHVAMRLRVMGKWPRGWGTSRTRHQRTCHLLKTQRKNWTRSILGKNSSG